MKAYSDKKRKAREFTEGDLVLLRLQPYRQHTVLRRSSQKLALRYYGPFEVLKKIGVVSYKLKLPESSRIHPVFHVSLLRPFVSKSSYKIHTLPPQFRDHKPLHLPVAILGEREVWKKGRKVKEVLIQWSNCSPEDTTWEEEGSILGQEGTHDGSEGSATNASGVDEKEQVLGKNKEKQARGAKEKEIEEIMARREKDEGDGSVVPQPNARQGEEEREQAVNENERQAINGINGSAPECDSSADNIQKKVLHATNSTHKSRLNSSDGARLEAQHVQDEKDVTKATGQPPIGSISPPISIHADMEICHGGRDVTDQLDIGPLIEQPNVAKGRPTRIRKEPIRYMDYE